MNPDPNQKTDAAPADTEPTVELRSPPVWPFVLIGILFFGSQLYMDKFSGGFRADVYAEVLKEPPPLADEPPEVIAARKGKEVFGSAGCVACHQASGLGITGQFPPLAGSEWVSAPKADRIIRIVLDGLGGPVKVKGEDWNNLMPPLRPTLTDEQIAAVLTFVRGNKDWAHTFGPVTPAQVKAIREATSAHTGTAWTNDELQKVPDGR